jgi:alpha-ketoglutarate-dependent taurine dioxygenase
VLFDNSRVSELAATIESLRSVDRAATEVPIIPIERNGELPMTFAQESLWVIDQLAPATGAYNIPRALRMKGSLDTEALQQSLNAIVSRHEVLRTVFRSTEGKPFALINADCKVELVIRVVADLDTEVPLQIAEESRRPFNLSTGPLLRATILRLNQVEHILIVTMHHIISDGWSMSLFLDELFSNYHDLLNGDELHADTLPIQYADFAAWQRNSRPLAKLNTSLAYWQQQLADSPAVAELPVYQPRPAIRSFQGNRHVFEIPASLTRAVKQLARAERVTLFMTLLGAFHTLLWTYSKHDNVVTGSPSAGRRPGTENLIGYFVNTLVLKTSFSGNPTFREIMRRVAEATRDALDHEQAPFAKVVEALQTERTLSYNPVFQVWFVLQTGAGRAEAKHFPNLEVEPYPVYSEVTRHDLQLTMWENSEVLKAAFTYNTDILDLETVSLMAEQFLGLVARVVEEPDVRANDLPTLVEQGRNEHLRLRKAAPPVRTLNSARRKAVSVSAAGFMREDVVAPGVIQLQPAVEGVSLCHWVATHKQSVLGKLQMTGAILFRGFDLLSIEAFEQLLTSLSGELVDYSYRSTPRNQVSGKIYTSTHYPAHQTIALHNEMSYSRQWPMIIGFFCLQPAGEGGETPLADSRRVFAQIDPEIRKEFISKQVMYVRNYDDDALDLSWREVFQTNSRAEVENYCLKAGMKVEWNGDKQLRTSQVCQAVIEHPLTGEMVWFNQAHLFHVSSLEQDVRILLQSTSGGNEPRNAFFGDGSEIGEAVLNHIRSVYEKEMVTFPWQRGDVLILDNILKAHGRKPYRGPRQIVVGMGRLAESLRDN